MRTFTSITEAALVLLGEPEGGTRARQTAIFRQALREPGQAPLSTFKMTYGDRMPAAAALEIASTFPGHVNIIHDSATPAERDGFYLRGKDIFHADSDSIEEKAEALDEANRTLATVLIEAGINLHQATEMLNLSTTVNIVVTGNFFDFADIYRAHGHVDRGAHPATIRFVLDCWLDIGARNPALVEAYREVVS